MSSGKGDRYRPVNFKIYQENYEKIFNKKKVKRKTNGSKNCKIK